MGNGQQERAVHTPGKSDQQRVRISQQRNQLPLLVCNIFFIHVNSALQAIITQRNRSFYAKNIEPLQEVTLWSYDHRCSTGLSARVCFDGKILITVGSSAMPLFFNAGEPVDWAEPVIE